VYSAILAPYAVSSADFGVVYLGFIDAVLVSGRVPEGPGDSGLEILQAGS